ncbi:CRAL-TRIO domain-containing protein [Ochromonadaceae sp. CCMP2298]|nr:CRAL-TRIO domain-containing protein [Ochromonadaceae sp. CCMP2298]|mmetsp:Transcript_4712/g.10600  ORF Transcript_4712/g.10600 Transcript_4712/m.10600 type:complete len:249 (+) Transcript_4712:180-926(+)|eukprot:CAMPEP_0173203736 /NCGR_PEP_ID=MMETSP1141-20130122/19695_1 /TAXON_ID=483371 /ORGANISM="non described non described, Strain CCMP2298" /LENGTH=248 /DNA_ID=CAMNT_0014129247 /DNA_START=96 /DNA_END=842 /DNA_ORIENTATION=-
MSTEPVAAPIIQASKDPLEELLSKFPEVENRRMVTAVAECCLAFKYNDLAEAAQCLGNYIKWRRKLFGNLEDQTIDEGLIEQLKSGFMNFSGKLEDGRGVIYLSMKHLDATKYSTSLTIKAMHFFIMSAMLEDPLLCRDGFVLVTDMVDVSMKNLDLSFPGAIASAVSNSIPIRLKLIVILHPPTIVRILVPAVRAILSSTLLGRLYVVSSTDALEQLLDAGAPVEGLLDTLDTESRVNRIINEQWLV